MFRLIILLLANFSVLFLPAKVLAQDRTLVSVEEINKIARDNPLLDPSFHDYVESNYGILRPDISKKAFRDALSSDSRANLPSPGMQGSLNRFVQENMPLNVSSIRTGTVLIRGESMHHLSDTTDSKLIFDIDIFETSVNPLLYKVKFAGETSPISGFVPPLDYSANEVISYENYVFVHIVIKGQEHSKLLADLSAKTDFRLVGHRAVDGLQKDSRMILLGWAPYNNISRIYRNSQVLRVSVEKNPDAFPVKVRVDFILKIPYMSNHEEFAVAFLNYAGKQLEFAPEKITKHEERFSPITVSRFSALNIGGNLPVNKVTELLKSPFVTNLKVQN